MNTCRTRKLLSVIMVLIAIFTVFTYPLSSMRSSAAENYRLWRQNDSRWGSITLGSSSQTMASSGCLVTSIAILAVHSGAENPDSFNPGTLAKSLNAIGGFSGGAIASWAKINQAIPDVAFVKKYSFTSSSQSGKATEMLKIHNQGYYMTCNVGNHWVFIDSIVGSEVYMIDPAKDETNMFDAYPLSSITELRVFSGKNPPSNSTAANTATTVPTTKAPTTAAPTTQPYKFGEYYSQQSPVNIMSSSSSNAKVIEVLEPGYIVNITKVENKMGCIQLGAECGWIDMKKIKYCGDPLKLTTGDINNDKQVDKVDLAMLNEYISSLSILPDGISLLRECEVKAADMNNDGIVDNADVLSYLSIICE